MARSQRRNRYGSLTVLLNHSDAFHTQVMKIRNSEYSDFTLKVLFALVASLLEKNIKGGTARKVDGGKDAVLDTYRSIRGCLFHDLPKRPPSLSWVCLHNISFFYDVT